MVRDVFFALLWTLVLPAGAALSAGFATAALVEPAWASGGLPYYLGYPKNAESAAVSVALLAGILVPLARRSRVATAAVAALTAVGVSTAWLRYGGPSAVAWIPNLLLLGGLGAAFAAVLPPGEGDWPVPGRPGPAFVLALAAVAAAAFLSGAPSLIVDVFHHGEILASAVDFARGGRPFESMIWPHGFHDTGLTAVWMALTGKVGTSPIALGAAAEAALGVLVIALLARPWLSPATTILLAAAWPIVALGEGRDLLLGALGRNVFVAIALVLITRRFGALTSGVAVGVGYLFRIETGVFAAMGALTTVGALALTGGGRALRERLWQASRDGTLFLVGAILPHILLAMTAGWPGREWYVFTLDLLPRFHRDASGLPFPFPTPDLAAPLYDLSRVGITRLLLTILLGAVTVERLAAVRTPRVPLWLHHLLFLSAFSLFAVRIALGRSDGHVRNWTGLPLLGVIVLLVGAASVRGRWRTAVTMAVVTGSVAVVDPSVLEVRLPDPRASAAWVASLPDRYASLREHLSPNPPVGACADRSLTALEAAIPANADLVAATCETEAILRRHEVRRLALDHTAPWYAVRFGAWFPTRYYAPMRAFTPALERELVERLRAGAPDALLRVSPRFGAVRAYDVPNGFRIPVVEAYLRARRRGAPVVPTPLGDLYLWNEPGTPAREPEPQAGPEGPVAGWLHTTGAVVDRATGFLDARGYVVAMAELPGTAVWVGGEPVADFELIGAGAWRFSLRLAPEAAEQASLRVRYRTGSGRVGEQDLDLTGARRLPGVRTWRDVGIALAEVEAEGRRDRLTAVEGRAAAARTPR